MVKRREEKKTPLNIIHITISVDVQEEKNIKIHDIIHTLFDEIDIPKNLFSYINFIKRRS